MDVFGVRRRLLYRRLWRARCRLSSDADKVKVEVKVVEDEVTVLRRLKAVVRLLTKSLSVTQLETLVDVVERRALHIHCLVSIS